MSIFLRLSHQNLIKVNIYYFLRQNTLNCKIRVVENLTCFRYCIEAKYIDSDGLRKDEDQGANKAYIYNGILEVIHINAKYYNEMQNMKTPRLYILIYSKQEGLKCNFNYSHRIKLSTRVSKIISITQYLKENFRVLHK